MWRNYVTVGIRALVKNRTYAFINIFGLAIGLAACLMLLLYVRYERSYENWIPGAGDVYQLQTTFRDPETGLPMEIQMAPFPAGQALARDFAQVERQVYLLSGSHVTIHNGEALAIENGVMVDNLLFDVLPLPMARGDPATALREVGSVVLSESEARRLFGEADPVGRTLTMVSRGAQVDRRVTGVIRDMPRNSHMRFNYIERFDPQTYFADNQAFLISWGNNSGWVYARLRPGTDPETIHAAMPQWERRNIPAMQFGDRSIDLGEIGDWRLVNIGDVHLGRAQEGALRPGNDERTILTFTIVAFLILGMACINFTNLATARAGQRAREVALRKVLGASRRQLVVQFIGESVLVAAVAMLLALALVELLLPSLSAFLDADLAMTYFGAGDMLLPILLLTALVGAAGGVYPALYLSRFQPAQVLKANKSSADASGSGWLRSALVIAQFAVSIGLIICTAVVYAQTVHARTADPGYQREGLFQVVGIGRRQLIERSETISREIGRIDGVVSVGRTSIGVATPNQNNTGVRVPGRDQPVLIGNYVVDAPFFQTMGIDLIAGRLPDADRPLDVDARPLQPTLEEDRAFTARGVNVVINELAARRLGFQDPSRAVGAQFRAALSDNLELGLTPINVVGVVRDTRFRSIREPLEPLMFRLSTGPGFSHLVIRYDSADPAAVRERVGQAWHRLAPDVPFDGTFSDDIVAELYGAEAARSRVFAGFALLAVVIACLGLFGLAAFTAERRTKEIGVRKVLGARTRDIVRLLAWQFSKPVIVANLIAWPVAWWTMRDWLNTFDTRIDLGPTPFVLAGLLALAIAIGTIAGHAFRVARANPILALRYE